MRLAYLAILAPLALFASGAVVACGKLDAPDEADAIADAAPDVPWLEQCPPAPLDYPALRDSGMTCRAPLGCGYAPPTGIVTNMYDECNGLSLQCTPDAGLHLLTTLIGCWKAPPPLCPADAVDGAACSSDASTRNGECFAPSGAPPTGAPGEVVAGRACACDLPGPRWRCLAGTYRGK